MLKILITAAVALTVFSTLATSAWAATKYYYRCTGNHEFYGSSGADIGPFADHNSADLACVRHARENSGHNCYVFSREE